MAYKNYDQNVDYSIKLDEMMRAGASAAEVQEMLDRRVSKAMASEKLRPYAFDGAYEKARAYIDRKSAFAPVYGEIGRESGASSGKRTKNRYEERLESALDALEEREPFVYDPEDDPAYKAYRSMYRREGERARREAIGTAAAMSGGQASTAAVTAASQAADYYNAKMGDVIPSLYELAFEMYRAEGQDLAAQSERIAALYEKEEARQAASGKADREFDFRVWESNRDYAQSLYNDTKKRDETARAAYQSAENEAYDRAMAFLKQGVMPTGAMLKAAGIDKASAQSLRARAPRKG